MDEGERVGTDVVRMEWNVTRMLSKHSIDKDPRLRLMSIGVITNLPL